MRIVELNGARSAGPLGAYDKKLALMNTKLLMEIGG